MALRLAVRRSVTACNGVARVFTYEPVFGRRYASAMAVPTESQAEETKNDYLVRIIPTNDRDVAN